VTEEEEHDRLLTPEQVADRLALAPSTARDWLRSGVLPAFKLGRRGLLRMRQSDLDAFIRGEYELNMPPEDEA
jgi:excisionase family DNA binding protein